MVLCIRCLIFVCVFFSRFNPASASPSLGRGARGRPDLLVTSSHWSPLWSKYVQHVKLQQSGAASGASFINSSIKYSPTLAARHPPPLLSAIPSTSLHYSWFFSWWSKQKESWSHEVQTGITMSLSARDFVTVSILITWITLRCLICKRDLQISFILLSLSRQKSLQFLCSSITLC